MRDKITILLYFTEIKIKQVKEVGIVITDDANLKHRKHWDSEICVPKTKKC